MYYTFKRTSNQAHSRTSARPTRIKSFDPTYNSIANSPGPIPDIIAHVDALGGRPAVTPPPPSYSTYVNAVNDIDKLGMAPAGWTQFSQYQLDSNGLQGAVYVNASGQVMFAMLGNVPTQPGILTADGAIMNGVAPANYETAIQSWVNSQAAALATEGYNVSPNATNDFTAGNSLGGFGAQYLSSQMGWGGVSLGGPGLIGYTNAHPEEDSNFTSYVNYGDPVANFSTDTGIDYYSATPSVAADHYGNVVYLGNGQLQELLQSALAFADPSSQQGQFYLGLTSPETMWAGDNTLASLVVNTHFLSDYATQGGASLSGPTSTTVDGLGTSLLPRVDLDGETGTFGDSLVNGQLDFSATGSAGNETGVLTDSSGLLSFSYTFQYQGLQTDGSASWFGNGSGTGLLNFLNQSGGSAGSVVASTLSSGPITEQETSYAGPNGTGGITGEGAFLAPNYSQGVDDIDLSGYSITLGQGTVASNSGGNDTYTLDGLNQLSVSGTSNSITDTVGGSTVNLGVGSTAYFTGINDNFTLNNNVQFTDTDASGVTVNLDPGCTDGIHCAGNTVNLSNNDNLTDDGDTVNVTANQTDTVTGYLDTLFASNSDTLTISDSGGSLHLGASDSVTDDGSGLLVSDSTGVTGGSLTLGVSNLGVTDDANGLIFKDASGVTGGSLTLGISKLGLTDDGSGVLVGDATGVTGGTLTLGLSNLGITDDANGLIFKDASGVTGGSLTLDLSGLGLTDDAKGVLVSDAAGVTGGSLTLGVSNLGLTDAAAGLVLNDGSGITGGTITISAGNLTLTDDASGITVATSLVDTVDFGIGETGTLNGVIGDTAVLLGGNTFSAISTTPFTININGIDTINASDEYINLESASASATINGSYNNIISDAAYSATELTFNGSSDTAVWNNISADTNISEAFAPNSSILVQYEYQDYGLNGKGTNTEAFINFAAGGCEACFYAGSGLASGDTSQIDQFSGQYNGSSLSGNITDQKTTYTAGNSLDENFDPGNGEWTSWNYFSSTGSTTESIINYTNGTLLAQYYSGSGLASEYTSQTNLYTGSYNGSTISGTLDSEQFVYTAGNSFSENFDPGNGELTTWTYSSSTGTETESIANYTNGSLEANYYSGSGLASEYASQTNWYTGSYNGSTISGTLDSELFNYTAGNSYYADYSYVWTNPNNSNITAHGAFEDWSEQNGTGDNTENFINLDVEGTQELQVQTLTDNQIVTYSDYNGSYNGSAQTGSIIQTTNNHDGASATTFYDPSDDISEIYEQTSEQDDEGVLESAVDYFDPGYHQGDIITVNYTYNSNNQLTSYEEYWENSSAQEIGNADYNADGGYVSGSFDGALDGSTGTGGYGGGYSGGYGAYGMVAGTKTKGTSIGVIAQYDLAQANNPTAAVEAEVARAEASQAAGGTSGTPPLTAPEFESGKWGSKVITWSLATSAGSPAGPFSSYITPQYEAVIEKAFETWAAASGLTFVQVADLGQSDIRIGWGDFDTSTTGVAGYTNYNQKSGQFIPGMTIRLEDPTQDALELQPDGQLGYSGTQTTLYELALHEIGHALGLADNDDPNSVMYYTSGFTNQTLDATDISGIQDLYGLKTNAPTASTVALVTETGGLGSSGAIDSIIQAMASFSPTSMPVASTLQTPRVNQPLSLAIPVHA